MKRSVLKWIVLVTVFVMLLPVGGLAANRPAMPASSARLEADASTGVFINEVMFAPRSGAYEWVELKNGGSSSMSIGGYGLTDEDGNWYHIPTALPPVPAGTFVVVVFDGQGAADDDLDFGDNVAILHSQPGLTNIFEDTADQVALYEAPSATYDHHLFLPLILRSSSSTSSALAANDTPGIGPTCHSC